MNRSDAQLPDSIAVFLGWIPDISLPTVARKFPRQILHQIITVSFGQYRRSGNGHVFRVSLNDTFKRQITVRLEAIAVDEQQLGPRGQLIQCEVHGSEGSIKDVDLVNLRMAHFSNGPGQGRLHDDFSDLQSLVLCHLFGVIQLLAAKLLRQYYSGGNNRTGQGPATHLVTPCLNQIFRE